MNIGVHINFLSKAFEFFAIISIFLQIISILLCWLVTANLSNQIGKDLNTRIHFNKFEKKETSTRLMKSRFIGMRSLWLMVLDF